MRTAAICPTCATYTNAVCVIYDGPAVLTNIPASPLDNLDEILVALNTTIGGINTSITNLGSNKVPYTGATGPVNLGAFPITANSFIKAGGLSTQFLKADGSIDSTTYLSTIPTINQVLTAGNTATDKDLIITTTGVGTIKLDGTTLPLLQIDSIVGLYTYQGAINAAGGSFKDVTQNLRGDYNVYGTEYFDITSGKSLTISANPANFNSNTIDYPSGTGTFALSVNGIGAGSNGDITLPPSGWALTGNAGTNPATNFIGTTDNQNVVFKANNSEVLKLFSTSNNVSFTSPDVAITGFPATGVQVYPASGNRGAKLGQDSTNGGYITLGNDTGSAGVIRSTNVSANRIYDIPNASGTLALSVNGVAAGTNGDVPLFSGYTGAITVGLQTLNFTNGILTSVV